MCVVVRHRDDDIVCDVPCVCCVVRRDASLRAAVCW